MPKKNETDEESCNLWRLRNEHDIEQYLKERNTRDILTAEARVKLFVDAEITSPQKIAAVGLDPIVRASITQTEYSATFSADLPDLVKQLRERCNKQFNPEKTLIAQATTLDAIFNSLATQAACVGWNTNTDKAEQLLKLAFKAQNQCAKTLQVILMNQSKPNELLVGESNGSSKMVAGTAPSAIESNSTMATLVCIDGRKI